MPVEFQFDPQKTLAAVTYIASKNLPELTTYKLIKLVFLADKYHLVKFGRIITGDRYVAIEHGPAPSRLYDILKDIVNETDKQQWSAVFRENLEVDKSFQYPRFRAKKQFDAEELSVSDLRALDSAIERFGHMDFFQIKAITHEMIAYKKAWNQKPEGVNANDMSIEEFFEEDSDAATGAKEEMLEDDFLRKIFPAR